MTNNRLETALGRLGMLAAAVSVVGLTPGPALEPPRQEPAQVWESVSVTEQDTTSDRSRAAERCRAELVKTAQLLLCGDLVTDASFSDFVDQVHAALDAWEAAPKTAASIVHLATAVALARASFEGRTADFTSWLGIARSTHEPDLVRVPSRFVATEGPAVEFQVPSHDDVALALSFDELIPS